MGVLVRGDQLRASVPPSLSNEAGATCCPGCPAAPCPSPARPNLRQRDTALGGEGWGVEGGWTPWDRAALPSSPHWVPLGWTPTHTPRCEPGGCSGGAVDPSVAVATEGLAQPASRILHPAYSLPHPASRILYPASHISNPASHISNPASRIPHPAYCIPHPPCCILPPTSLFVHPTSSSAARVLIPHPSSHTPGPPQPHTPAPPPLPPPAHPPGHYFSPGGYFSPGQC